ncbi:MAG TPA: WYL domain-containing protein [Chitinophagaceae bacterium]|nr:WYL domain-containing protein [Chitinophagaceae bacterium]
MPVNKDALSRYRWIDERLRNRRLPPPTLDVLIEYVSRKLGKGVAKRTIQKDIYDMRSSEELNYQAPIVYTPRTRAYSYESEDFSISNMPVSEFDLQGLEIAISILEQFRNLPVIRQFEDAILRIGSSLKINRERLKTQGMIRLDTPASYKGLEWITDIVESMKDRKMIRISYQSFSRDTPKEHWIEPYHLREYNNRFYLVGKSTRSGNRILTFGLDRMINLWPTDQSFDAPGFDDQAFFGSVLGISAPDQQPQRIELEFSPQQAKYIKSQPIHLSQQILKDSPSVCRIRLDLVINHELLMLLLSYGSGVRVIRPGSLANRIREEALAIGKLYA